LQGIGAGIGANNSFALTTAPLPQPPSGQVHRALTLDNEDVAIKIQYPGVRRSIDSDVDNVATLLKLSHLLPSTLDIAPLLVVGKAPVT